MYEAERDAYAEAHSGPSKRIWRLVWLGWLLMSTAALLVGAALGEAVEAAIISPDPSARRILSLEQTVETDGAISYLASVAGGLVAGLVLALAQGLMLLPFLKRSGATQWMAATLVGRALRWVAVYIISRELVGLTADRSPEGICFVFTVLVGTAVIAGVTLGYPQHLVLRRRVAHSEWWVWANIAGPVLGALLIFLALFVETENNLRDFIPALIALVGAGSTGIALIDLLRHPTKEAEWSERFTGGRESRLRTATAAQQQDTVLGSSLYQTAPGHTNTPEAGGTQTPADNNR